MTDPMQQARELLAIEMEKSGRKGTANKIRQGRPAMFREEIRAIAAALHTAPEGFVLVPVEPTPEMLMAAGNAVHSATYWTTAWAAMLAARPQGVNHG